MSHHAALECLYRHALWQCFRLISLALQKDSHDAHLRARAKETFEGIMEHYAALRAQ